MTKMIDDLHILGMTRNEAEVYEQLVKSGQTKAGHLIARLDIHRNIVYEALDSLIKKAFVTKIEKRGVWWFQITEPDTILTMLKRREQIAENVIKEIKHARQQIEQQITVYEGIDSYRAYWISSLERFPEGSTDYCLGVPSQGLWIELLGPAAYKKYMEVRKRKKLFWKSIITKITPEETQLFKEAPELTEFRLWDQPFEQIGNFNIVYDSVILQVMKRDAQRIIEIRDPDVVTIFQNYFDVIWNMAKPIAF
jgi:sugar-specific transcriptional regulator TrmB